jgi:assimilatory nitrate reductase catalytic subunit
MLRTLARKPGLKALDLFRAIESGQIKAVWIIGTNPLFSLPEAERFERALRDCPLVVVSDCVRETETTRVADVLLPATTWGEKDGTVTNSERRISRQRPFREPPGEARHDWWALTEVARRLGFAGAFPYTRAVEIFREHAALSAFENAGTRDFDIGALADLSDAGYDALEPVQWPLPAGSDDRHYPPLSRRSLLYGQRPCAPSRRSIRAPPPTRSTPTTRCA